MIGILFYMLLIKFYNKSTTKTRINVVINQNINKKTSEKYCPTNDVTFDSTKIVFLRSSRWICMSTWRPGDDQNMANPKEILIYFDAFKCDVLNVNTCKYCPTYRM